MTLDLPKRNPTKIRSRTRVLNTQRRFKIFTAAVSAFCDGVLCALGSRDYALTVVFVNAATMRKLNRQYRRLDYATDVLSFGYQDEIEEGRPFLGEIVIAPEIAHRQARNWRCGPEREMRKLLVHGILHLLGYDHETDEGEMNLIQRRIVRRQLFGRGRPVADMRAAK